MKHFIPSVLLIILMVSDMSRTDFGLPVERLNSRIHPWLKTLFLLSLPSSLVSVYLSDSRGLTRYTDLIVRVASGLWVSRAANAVDKLIISELQLRVGTGRGLRLDPDSCLPISNLRGDDDDDDFANEGYGKSPTGYTRRADVRV